jgi:hypothetical protein
MKIPDWYTLALLAFAAFRTFRLIAEDDILDRPRAWLLRYRGWDGTGPPPKGYRVKWGEWITCPWCAGFWISILWWGAWQVWPHGTTVSAVPLAVSALLALIAKNLDE